MNHRPGMTLIEVVLAMGLIAVGVVAVAMTLPAALRLQEKTRFQLYASGKALEMVDRFLGESPLTDLGGSYTLEANRPWNVPTGRRNFDPDLELRSAIQRGSLFPMPRELAYRIDSPDHEIRKLLDAGGQLYYSNPVSAHPLKGDNPLQPRPPNEAMRLVIGIVGDPQQNAIQHYPWKGWPYYTAYPSPPTAVSHSDGQDYEWWKRVKNEVLEYNTCDQDGDGKPDIDPDMEPLWWTNLKDAGTTYDFDGNPADWTLPNFSGFRNYTTQSNITGRSGNNWGVDEDAYLRWLQTCGWNQAKGQLMLALWYGWRKGLPATVLYGRATAADIQTVAADPRKLRALRYLAFAGGCMTKWFPLAPEPAVAGPPARSAHDGLKKENGILLPGDDDDPGIPGRVWPAASFPNLMDLLAGAGLADGPAPNPFDPANLDPIPGTHPARSDGARTRVLSGHMAVRLPMIQNWHETCLAAFMRYGTSNPYDWAEPRALQRQLFTDHPLIQWDICAPASDQLSTDANGILGTITDAGLGGQSRIQARMWRPLAARRITNQGYNARGQDLPNDAGADYDTIKGTDPTRFNLALPFDPSERCRQIVFWAVDWTSWEDWETSPSAPVDAARYPRRHETNTSTAFTSNIQLEFMNNGQSGMDRCVYEHKTPLYRNPEKQRSFVLDMTGFATGANVLYYTAGSDGGHDANGTEKSAYAFRNKGGNDMWDERVDMYCQGRTYPATLAGVATNAKHPYYVFSGLFGADRNGNGRLDRGPLPASVRLRATEISRLNYYDPRLGVSLR